jgi:hypothetical protein
VCFLFSFSFSFFCARGVLTMRRGRSYDLKQEISKSPVSRLAPELAKHPAAQTRMTRDYKRKAEEQD